MRLRAVGSTNPISILEKRGWWTSMDSRLRGNDRSQWNSTTSSFPRRRESMVTLIFECLFLFLLFLASCSTASLAQERVPLTINGQAAVYLVQDSSPNSEMEPVLKDFTKSIREMSGTEIGEEQKPGLLPLFIGETGEFKDLPFSAPNLEKESFLYQVTPKGIYLLGGSPTGTSHAVYTLLKDLGCRWILPGEIGECLPVNPNLSLPVGERTESPDFAYRIIWYAYGCPPDAAARYAEWLRRNRMGKPNIQHGHNLTQTLARKATFEEHPDLYSLVEGTRVKQQICTSNPEAVRLVIESIDEYLDQNPTVESYSLCPDDNTDFCECAHCRALDVEHMDRGGKPSVSDRYQIFLNQVLEALQKNHPGVCVTTYSYNQNHTDPPQKAPVHPNTTVFITTSAFCSAHGIGDTFCESRQDFRKLLGEWSGHTQRLIIYEYDPVPFSGALPWPMWSAHIHEMPLYKQMGIRGLSYEGQNSWAAYYPNYYVASQLMWDSGQDGEKVFQDMLDSFFQEAAPAMTGFYDAMESKTGSFTPKVEWGLIQYPELFPTTVTDACEKALSKAEQLATSEVVKKRIEMVRLSFEEMKSYLAVRDPRRSASFEEYRTHVAGLRDSIDRLEAINDDYILADIAHQKTENAVGEHYAPEFGFITRWQLCGPFDNPGMEGHDTPYPPEEKIDLSAHYPGKGGDASWKLNTGPDWRAFADLRDEYTEKDNAVAYAACWVTLADGPRQAEFRMGSNDSIKAFLNGKEIWNHKIERSATIDEDRIVVELPKGTSTVLLKIGQTGKNWGFFFRIMEPGTEEILQGLSVSPSPPK